MLRVWCIVSLLLLIPVFLMSSLFTVNPFNRFKPVSVPKSFDRTWLMNEVLEESHDGMDWVEDGKYFFIYSENYPTRLDTVKYCHWDEDEETWIPFLVQSITYDASNEYVTQLNAAVSYLGMILPIYRGTYNYDNQDRLTQAVIEFYDDDEMIWMTAFRINIVYISNTNYTVYNYQLGDDGQTPQWYRQNFEWDAQGRVIVEVQSVSTDSLNWTNAERSFYTYHPNDTTTGDIFVSNVAHYLPLQSIYDMTGTEYFFGMVSEETKQEWVDPDWVNYERVLRTYTAFNKISEEFKHVWSMSDWADDYVDLFTYDANNNPHQRTSSYRQDMMWIPEARLTYIWGQGTAAEDNSAPAVNHLALTAMPNPFTGSVSFKVDSKATQPLKLSVYNTKGQKIASMNAKTNSEIVWDGKDSRMNTVPNGVYFLKAETETGVRTAKILKLK